jgi:hypothetical protein
MNPRKFNSPIPTAVTEPKGTIYLCAWVSINGQWFEGHILEASAETQGARVIVPGRGTFTVEFRHISNVCLKYADGTVIESFGSPKLSRPESVPYLQSRTTVQ